MRGAPVDEIGPEQEAGLSRSFTRWAAETANDTITAGPPPGSVEISCGSGGDSHFQYTAVYGLALNPSIASVSAQMGGQTHQATFVAGRSFLLAIPRAVAVRNLMVRDRQGNLLWHAATSCFPQRPR